MGLDKWVLKFLDPNGTKKWILFGSCILGGCLVYDIFGAGYTVC